MPRRKKVVIGNWKMGPATLEEARSIFLSIRRAASSFRKTDVVICPSFVQMQPLSRLSNPKLQVGVQDVFFEAEGFFTGEVSAAQARNAGARYALCGHSERRVLGESAEQVAKKFSLILKAGMTAVLCIGEHERDRDGNFFSYLKDQILSGFSKIARQSISRSVILAYEPIWAIGRSSLEAMKPADVLQTTIYIRKVVNDAFGSRIAQALPILYGGSVTAENAGMIVSEGGVDGLLVGRQSLEPKGFITMLRNIDSGNVLR